MYEISEAAVLALNLGNKSAISILDMEDEASWDVAGQGMVWTPFMLKSFEFSKEPSVGKVKIPFSNSDVTQIGESKREKIELVGYLLSGIESISNSLNILDTISRTTKLACIITPRFCATGMLVLESRPKYTSNTNVVIFQATFHLYSLYFWNNGRLVQAGSSVSEERYSLNVVLTDNVFLEQYLFLEPELSSAIDEYLYIQENFFIEGTVTSNITLTENLYCTAAGLSLGEETPNTTDITLTENVILSENMSVIDSYPPVASDLAEYLFVTATLNAIETFNIVENPILSENLIINLTLGRVVS